MYRRIAFPLLGIVLTLGCERPPTSPIDTTLNPGATPGRQTSAAASSVAAGAPHTAIVQFGREQQGTDFFPPGSHDGSFHAKDAIRPRTVVIRAGGTVTFVISAAHKIAVYWPGKQPSDIDITSLEPPGTSFPFPPIINDPSGRMLRGSLDFGPPQPFDVTFDQPGRYLVICEVLPHFADAKMSAWVDVK
jgi:plastocyanin